MTPSPTARRVAAATAAVAVLGLAINWSLTIEWKLGEGASLPAALWLIAAYFTQWSNVTLVLVAGAVALAPGSRLADRRVVLATLVSILIAGVVFYALIWNPRPIEDWRQALGRVGNFILHAVTPLAFLATVVALRPRFRLADAAWTLVPPLVYGTYSLARGLGDGFFPYAFLDPTRQPLPSFLRSAALLFATFGALGLAVAALRSVTPPRRRSTRAAPPPTAG